jgi:hypothetical protein
LPVSTGPLGAHIPNSQGANKARPQGRPTNSCGRRWQAPNRDLASSRAVARRGRAHSFYIMSNRRMTSLRVCAGLAPGRGTACRPSRYPDIARSSGR